MGLLQSLGLPKPAAGPAPAGPAPRAAMPDASPSPSDTALPGPSDTQPRTRAPAPAPAIAELAKWPSKAHRAWKRLDYVRQAAVAVQMASLYGQKFADDFVAAAKSGKTKLEGADFVTALASQTPDAMKAAGYKLAQYASNGDRAQEWWVRPDGFEVFLLRVVKQGTKPPPSTTAPDVAPPVKQQPPVKPPVEPPGTCSKESQDQLDMALKWATDALAEAEQALKELEAEKARMLKLNVTSKDFEQAYNAMTEWFKDHIAHLESVIGDVTTTKEALQNSGCDLKKLDTARDDLDNALTGFEAEQGLHEMDIRKPIKVDVKDTPGGDDDE
ncbi:MAG: hypothetical protein ACXWJ1_08670 [Caldimonas sp.]